MELERRYSITIEGNIASGKSTLLECIKFPRIEDKSYTSGRGKDITILPEPIDKWKNWDGRNMLQLMYEYPKEYTKDFQKITQITVAENHNFQADTPLKIMERSIYTSLYVFAWLAYHDGNLTCDELKEIKDCFDDICQNINEPDFIIYLRTDPVKCFERMKIRNRGEEANVTLEYLKKLHDYHDKLFIDNQDKLPCAVVVINGDGASSSVSNKFVNFINTFTYKKCSKCGFNQSVDEFYAHRKSGGLQGYCKDCNRKNMRPYMNKRYKDPDFYQIHKLRVSSSRGNCSGSSKTYLGCPHYFYLKWLEHQRTYRVIIDEEIDHVLPVSKYKALPYLCFSWVNFSPISKIDNRAKRDKIDLELFYRQYVRAKYFLQAFSFPDKNDEQVTVEHYNNILNPLVSSVLVSSVLVSSVLI